MKVDFRFMRAVPLLALAACTTGCGSSSDSPTDASSPAGATIRGSVNSGAGAASEAAGALSASGKGLRVTVVGTELATTTDGTGSFTLQGIPPGNVALRFQGSGIDATLLIGGLAAGQVLTISVQVQGSRATVVTPTPGRPDVEISGKVESISPPNLQVAGRTVVTDKGTEFKGKGRLKSLADLNVGDSVRVEGTAQPGGSILAHEIDRRERAADDGDDDDEGDDDDNDKGEVEIKGKIESVSAPSLRVAGVTILTNSSTRIERDDRHVSLTALRVGERVEVEGMRQSDGSILARKIEVEEDDD